ncbi:MAG TPA: pitrilysin family protein [Gemmatimonadales bacterium]|nr:pitrilysin family protein [Gemmatimonadales bacterium]
MTTVRLDDGLFQTSAPNGCTLLTEKLPGVRSAALGIWVRSASAHEARPKMGVSHLLEHMVFKGTERRSARQIALELEVRGGSLDAYTSRDHTSYQAHVLDTDLPLASDILSDLVRRPLLREEDLIPERNVVLEEINGVEDTPDDLVFELHSETLWPTHPYGYSILGSAETVGALSAADLQASHRNGYFRGNCVIAAAGNVEHEALLEALAGEGWFEGPGLEAPLPPAAPGRPARGVIRQEGRDTTQAHIVFGTDTFPYADSRRYAMGMLVNAFGGGMSSRLFQRIREELGLAYAIYAYHQFYRSAGQSGVYIGTRPETAEQAIEAILGEYRLMATEGLSATEIEDARRQLKGQVMLGLESPQSRMNRLASLTLQGEPYRPLDRVLEEIDAVTADTLAAVATEFFAPERQTIVRLGPKL